MSSLLTKTPASGQPQQPPCAPCPNLPPEDADPLLRGFVDSPANTEHFDIAISALAHSTQVLPDATIMACERAVALAGTALGDITTRHPMTADNLISILLRLYRQGDATTQIPLPRRDRSALRITRPRPRPKAERSALTSFPD